MRLAGFKYLVLVGVLTGVGAPLIVLADADLGTTTLALSGDLSPQERLSKKIELAGDALDMAIGKAEAIQTDLKELTFESGSTEAQLRDRYLGEVSGYISFYGERKEALNTIGSLEEIDALIQTIIEYREAVYAPSAKHVLEFILVLSYVPSVFDTAQERYNSITADVERLGELDLIEAEQFAGALEQCRLTLGEASALQAEAKQLVLSLFDTATTTAEAAATPPAEQSPGAEVTPPALSAEPATTTLTALSARELAEESLNKIKGLYNTFIETGQEVKKALGI
jgi:hypothetical protein